MKEGLYFNLENEAYHAGPGVSNSGLELVNRSPYHYWAAKLAPNRPPEPDKAGQLEGTLAHCAILEPHAFDDRYVVGPDVRRNTNEWKAFVAANEGKVVIKQEQRDAAFGQRAAVLRDCPEIGALIGGGEGAAEVSAYWRDPVTDVLCRCRPDWVHMTADGGVILIDVKTYGDARPDEFLRQIARKNYHRQAAMYTEGYAIAANRPVLGFIFLAVEDKYPFCASSVSLDEDSLRAGQLLYRDNLDTYAQCLHSNQWPGYSGSIEEGRLPEWALREVA